MPDTDNTVRLHRVLKAPPERVYRAFVDADALVQWIPPYGFTCKIHERNATVGGAYRMSFTNFTTGSSHSWHGRFLEWVPVTRIRYSDQFDDPSVPEEMIVTVNFREVVCGTELHITQENLPPLIPVEMCYLGWQESLQKLAHLVEPEIKE